MEKIIYEKKNFTIYRSCTVPIVVWPPFIAPFQLPWLRCSNYDQKKKIQSSVCCYAILTTTGKKKIQSSGHHLLRRSNCHCCVYPITTGKKDTVVCPLLRHSNCDRKKRYSHLAIIPCAVPIADMKPGPQELAFRKTGISVSGHETRSTGKIDVLLFLPRIRFTRNHPIFTRNWMYRI